MTTPMQVYEEEIIYWTKTLNEFLQDELDERAAKMAARWISNLTTNAICLGQERGRKQK